MDKDMDQRRTTNCGACGTEYFADELRTVKISGFAAPISVCEECLSKSTYQSYKDAADVLADIVKIAFREKKDPEDRLAQIRKLLGE
jgi:hypothetical protein